MNDEAEIQLVPDDSTIFNPNNFQTSKQTKQNKRPIRWRHRRVWARTSSGGVTPPELYLYSLQTSVKRLVSLKTSRFTDTNESLCRRICPCKATRVGRYASAAVESGHGRIRVARRPLSQLVNPPAYLQKAPHGIRIPRMHRLYTVVL